MAPRKLPVTLYDSCLKFCVRLINLTAYNISKSCNTFPECQEKAASIKKYLQERLPPRFFDDFCFLRAEYEYEGHLAIQFMLMTHPSLTVLRRTTFDNTFTPEYWINTLPNFTRLLVLDLKFLCTDEILKVVGKHCPLLEDVNIVSKAFIKKSLVNAYVLMRKVSDDGLKHVAKLKRLRILSMDPPRNDIMSRRGRNVTQNGIVSLICQLPQLEELQIETCDVGALIIGCKLDIGPLSLTRINYHFATADGIGKLLKICPQLTALSFTNINYKDTNQIINCLAHSNITFNKLHLAYVVRSSPFMSLFHHKGANLVDIALSIDALDPDAIHYLGYACPLLERLSVIFTHISYDFPLRFTLPGKTGKQLFAKLNMLTIGSEHLKNISDVMYYFFSTTQSIKQLNIKCRQKTNLDNLIGELISSRLLMNLNELYLDSNLELSPGVVKHIIVSCNNLVCLKLLQSPEMIELDEFIKVNNYDMTLLGF